MFDLYRRGSPHPHSSPYSPVLVNKLSNSTVRINNSYYILFSPLKASVGLSILKNLLKVRTDRPSRDCPLITFSNLSPIDLSITNFLQEVYLPTEDSLLLRNTLNL